MSFEEIKIHLFDYYTEKGFQKVAINNSVTWMLKNENINNAYISLSKKDNGLKLDLFNVKAPADLENYRGIAIIETIDGESNIINVGNDKKLRNNKFEGYVRIKGWHTISLLAISPSNCAGVRFFSLSSSRIQPR